ncbi:MAG: hypothetical protein HYY86_00565 [Candidatus Harrisonbacteria bacterium]|nr:hypothetical protein [Candidatus Harrisonbacteria bacterium]
MNLKNLSYLPIAFLPFFINGCVSMAARKVNEPLIEIIWAEVKKMTNLDPNQPLPAINYSKNCYEYNNTQCYGKELCDPEAEWKRVEELKKSNKKEWNKCRKKIKTTALGIYYYHCQTIWICLNNTNKYHWEWTSGSGGLSLGLKEKEAAFYNTIAHELLHHALFLKGIKRENHRIMKEEGYLEKVIDVISRHLDLPLNGLQKEISMESLERGIQLDRDNNYKTLEREGPFIVKCGAGNDEIVYHENYGNFYIKCD